MTRHAASCVGRRGPRWRGLMAIVWLVVAACALPAAALEKAKPELIPTNGAVFFIRVSAPDSVVRLAPTEACAIEAACRFQEGWPIYILTNSTFHEEDLAHFTTWRFPSCVQLLLWDEYMAYWQQLGTLPELRAWYASGTWREGYFLNNLSNSMRLALLYNHGGIYLDTDLVLTRHFSVNLEKTGTAGWEDQGTRINNAALAFPAGHPFLQLAINAFVTEFDGTVWAHNGPTRLTSVYMKACAGSGPRHKDACDRLQILDTRAFYPVNYNHAGLFLRNGSDAKGRWMLRSWSVYGVHLWSKLLRESMQRAQEAGAGSVQPASTTLMTILARHSCPLTLERFSHARMVPIEISDGFSEEDKARFFELSQWDYRVTVAWRLFAASLWLLPIILFVFLLRRPALFKRVIESARTLANRFMNGVAHLLSRNPGH